jgi:energy-coupling factor transport system permease protein
MRLPYKSVLVTSLSTRFIPCLAEDVQRISDVYRTRGVLLDTGKWVTKLKKRVGIIIPLLCNSLDRAIQVAEAMEARAFGTGQKRVFYRDIKMSLLDLATLGVVMIPLFAGVILRIMKYGSYQFYPALEITNPALLEWVLLLILAFILLAIIPLAFLKRRMELD